MAKTLYGNLNIRTAPTDIRQALINFKNGAQIQTNKQLNEIASRQDRVSYLEKDGKKYMIIKTGVRLNKLGRPEAHLIFEFVDEMYNLLFIDTGEFIAPTVEEKSQYDKNKEILLSMAKNKNNNKNENTTEVVNKNNIPINKDIEELLNDDDEIIENRAIIEIKETTEENNIENTGEILKDKTDFMKDASDIAKYATEMADIAEKINENTPETTDDDSIFLDSSEFLENGLYSFEHYNKTFQEYFNDIISTVDIENVMPPANHIRSILKTNNININEAEFVKILQRLIFSEYTNWLYNKLNGKKTIINGQLLIDTNIIKFYGQSLLVLLTIRNNQIQSINLDCGLKELKIHNLTEKDATNQLTSWQEILNNNPLDMENIDLSGKNWKYHIFTDRKTRFGLTLSLTARQNIVINSLKYACQLEQRHINIKRLVRASSVSCSIAIPLIMNDYKTNSALILRFDRETRIYEPVTIIDGEMLEIDLKTYNLFDMPMWFKR